VSHLPFRGWQGNRVIGDLDPHAGRQPTPDVPYASVLIIPQWRTEQLLRQRLGELGGQVELATRLAGLAQDGDGVTATVVRDGAPEQLRAGFLVGCDGGHSTVRRLLGVGFQDETWETERMLVGDVEAEGLDREHWHVWPYAQGGMVGLCPLPGGRAFQFQASLAPGEPTQPSLKAFQRVLDERTGAGVRLHHPTWLSLWRANVRMVDRYRVDRVLLAGDAAHVHSPAGGQGMNTGIQDAYNLGWKLAAVIGGAPDRLLDTYQQERLPVAAWVLEASSRRHQELLKDRTGARSDGALRQLGIGYRGGPLARDLPEPEGSVRAGDRAPDAPCRTADGRRVRLFDRFRGPHWTLLAFGASHATAAAEVARRHRQAVHAHLVVRPGEPVGAHELVDVDGHARRAYDLDGDALVLVRPDGHIGLLARPGTAGQVAAYLDRLGVAAPAAVARP
jgi:2-polyprenyl-6-methoxyphenol hydroxylase-like FAD-dependent oxidoreductase